MGQYSDKFIKLLAETDNEELCNAFLDYQKEKQRRYTKPSRKLNPPLLSAINAMYLKNDIDE